MSEGSKSILFQESIDIDNVNLCNSHFHSPCSPCGCSNTHRSPDSPVLPEENPKKQNNIPTLPDFSKFTLGSKKMSEDSKSILSQESIDIDNVNLCNSYFHSPCSSCGCSNKRRSPDSPVLPAENPKKQNTIPTLPGFSKFTLGSTYSTQDSRIQSPSSPILRRCLSDPYKPPLSPGIQIPVTQSPLESGCLTTLASKGTASMPPRPPIRRCLSDSLPDKCFSRTSSAKDLSDSQFVRRMRGCLNLCLDEMMAEYKVEEEYKGTEEASMVTDSEETVSVERRGDCFIVHFKCSCSKRFNILLRGGEIYYKLP